RGQSPSGHQLPADQRTRDEDGRACSACPSGLESRRFIVRNGGDQSESTGERGDRRERSPVEHTDQQQRPEACHRQQSKSKERRKSRATRKDGPTCLREVGE